MTTRYPLACSVMLCLLSASGCATTDRLTVFENRLLSDAEMTSFLGEYELTDTADDDHLGVSGKLSVRRKGVRYYLELEIVNEDSERNTIEGYFLLSHIPKAHKVGIGETEVRFTTNRNTILISSPNLAGIKSDGDYENAFGLVRQDDDKLYFWMVSHDCPVAEGKLPEKDCYPSNEVKEFLSLHADAYARANEPIWTFTKK